MADAVTKIVRGIEWTLVGVQSPGFLDDEQWAASCARCGGDVEWVDCPNCGGEGYSHHDCGEDCCACLHPEDNVVCDWCSGECGGHHCTNTPDWCAAHPIAGRENVASTALNSQAWSDVL